VKIEPDKKQVIVGPESALESSSFNIRDVNWLGLKPDAEIEVVVKIRSTRPPVPARVKATGSGAVITLLQAEKSVSPGQACVMYDGSRVLGGGWITRSAV
jgi:tRNA-specific 2-thiouridylase